MPTQCHKMEEGGQTEEGGEANNYSVALLLLQPQLVTEAKDLEEAFAMARDAINALRESRQRYAQRIAQLEER